MTNNTIVNESNDKSYFTLTPNIVWALCESVYEFSLWSTIKMIAWDKGECFLSTPDLAKVAMMSSGKASQCRKSLLDKGLIKGELRKDPGYPQPVWHLSIPDLWQANITLMQSGNLTGIRGKVDWKKKQLSPDETKELSLRERGLSPDEKGLLQDEINNIQNKIQKQNLTPSNGGFPKVSKEKMECQMVDGLVYCWNCGDRMDKEELEKSNSFCVNDECKAPMYVWKETRKMGHKEWISRPEQPSSIGNGAFRQKPVNAFMALVNMPDISTKKRINWGKKLEECANTRNATVDQLVQAIEAIPNSEYKWMTPESPYGHKIQGAIDVLLARVIAGTLKTESQQQQQKEQLNPVVQYYMDQTGKTREEVEAALKAQAQ